jgi:dTDP-4-amino-4,6-dideoxygalactose transaminase
VQELTSRGIGSMCYYPVPLHLQQAFEKYGYRRGDLPISEMLAKDVLSLPMYPELEEHQVKIVAAALQEIVGARMIAAPVVNPITTPGFIA